MVYPFYQQMMLCLRAVILFVTGNMASVGLLNCLSSALQILAVEVMWTPQDENDAYSRDELFLDYPTLNTL